MSVTGISKPSSSPTDTSTTEGGSGQDDLATAQSNIDRSAEALKDSDTSNDAAAVAQLDKTNTDLEKMLQDEESKGSGADAKKMDQIDQMMTQIAELKKLDPGSKKD